jgi:hypothetical protein
VRGAQRRQHCQSHASSHQRQLQREAGNLDAALQLRLELAQGSGEGGLVDVQCLAGLRDVAQSCGGREHPVVAVRDVHNKR